MSAALDLQVIAEGIETIDQLRLLQSMNCELGQGYLFSQPTTYDEIEALIVAGHVYSVGQGDSAPIVPLQRGLQVSDQILDSELG
jgi:predicted signal transduction protein with EAL and GGDEF domain